MHRHDVEHTLSLFQMKLVREFSKSCVLQEIFSQATLVLNGIGFSNLCDNCDNLHLATVTVVTHIRKVSVRIQAVVVAVIPVKTAPHSATECPLRNTTTETPVKADNEETITQGVDRPEIEDSSLWTDKGEGLPNEKQKAKAADASSHSAL